MMKTIGQLKGKCSVHVALKNVISGKVRYELGERTQGLSELGWDKVHCHVYFSCGKVIICRTRSFMCLKHLAERS